MTCGRAEGTATTSLTRRDHSWATSTPQEQNLGQRVGQYLVYTIYLAYNLKERDMWTHGCSGTKGVSGQRLSPNTFEFPEEVRDFDDTKKLFFHVGILDL